MLLPPIKYPQCDPQRQVSQVTCWSKPADVPHMQPGLLLNTDKNEATHRVCDFRLFYHLASKLANRLFDKR
jgi:hypothetical protein